MKITKAGIPKDTQEYPTKCLSCKCEFTFTTKEIKREENIRGNLVGVMTCPQEGCGAKVYVPLYPL